MKLLLISLIVGSLMVASISAQGAIYHNATHPDYPGQCYYEKYSIALPVGGVFQPTNLCACEKSTCRDDLVLEMNFCPRHNMQETDDCSIVTDDTLAYPDCCPKLVCKDTEKRNKKTCSSYYREKTKVEVCFTE
uniref:Single domain-containing protein n=1 Tax=Glossina palpalis gambiensis TaxID=67801 RepID=A0A1B0ALQ3_9MUSC